MSKTTELRKRLMAQATHTDNNGKLYKYVNGRLFRYKESSNWWPGLRDQFLHWSICDYSPCTFTGGLYEVR